jgi:hypothetical protein
MGSLGRPKRNDSKPTTTIGIAHNLAIALRHLRHAKKPRILWIDALCINQDDVSERSAEVLEMGSIYSNARQVIVWLGPSSSNSKLAIDSLIRIREGITWSDETRTFTSKTNSWAEFLHDNVDALKSNAPSWIAIRDLLNREWFSRLWVFQEIGLATNATVFAGADSIDWQMFRFALEWLWPILWHLNQLIENLAIEDFTSSSIAGFLELTKGQTPQYRSLYWLLSMTMKLCASDPRDRLYSIRGLAVPEDRKCIVPDYSKNVEEVFKYFTLQLIQEHESGEILAKCLLQSTPSILQLPSWVPNLSLPNFPLPFYGFQASGMSRVAAVNIHQSLSVQAIEVATITDLMPFVISSNTDSEVIDLCRTWKQLCPFGAYIGSGSTSDAFLETILCGELAELWAPNLRPFFSLKECKKVLDDFGIVEGEDELESPARQFAREVRNNLCGRAFFKTREGYFGACSDSANTGDQVVIVLGCKSPLVLRTDRTFTLQRETFYRVVGECYVPGVMHGEALLGPLPVGWEVRHELVSNSLNPVFTCGETVTQKDPRLPLPPQWRHLYGDGKTFQNFESKQVKRMRDQWFENVETKQRTKFDPRLTPDALRERGVDVREFVLV